MTYQELKPSVQASLAGGSHFGARRVKQFSPVPVVSPSFTPSEREKGREKEGNPFLPSETERALHRDRNLLLSAEDLIRPKQGLTSLLGEKVRMHMMWQRICKLQHHNHPK